jgi:hypothetical protein
MSVRVSFVQHFGEDDAVRIEEASIQHINDTSAVHGDDNWGSDPFRYHLLNCIGHNCLDRFRKYHGIDADAQLIRDWVLAEAGLAYYDGDIPDYIALMGGAYQDWIAVHEVSEDSVLLRINPLAVMGELMSIIERATTQLSLHNPKDEHSER